MNKRELIYYVDENDLPTGEASEKLVAHTAKTRLHAAFSCYIFSESGKFLITKRADGKKVWPGVWTNSCCGHPAPGESREDAIRRRTDVELGLQVGEIKCVVEKYAYKTPPLHGVVEHEFCPIYVAMALNDPKPNPEEVSDFEWITWEEYIERITQDTDDYEDQQNPPRWSWWCKDQLKHLQSNKLFTDYLAQATS